VSYNFQLAVSTCPCPYSSFIARWFEGSSLAKVLTVKVVVWV